MTPSKNDLGNTEPVAQGTSSRSGSSSNPWPVPATPLIGRTSEASLACQLLKREGVRLVTLTGPGGIGKTRLALQIASELQPQFADGVYWVTLASLNDVALVMPTIAQVFGLKDQGDRPILDRLADYLRPQSLLLLLDNFEQVVLAAPQIAELLAQCPSLKILATSRALLRIRAEYEFPVPPLSLPAGLALQASSHAPLPTLRARELSQYAAIGLFIERASAVQPDFQLTDENASAVTAVCSQLDGLPLAIELAAARIKLLTPQAMLARLAQRMDWLTSGNRDMPWRQQTLRNTLNWSYDLLGQAEQQLFRRMGVFVGGCSLEAVQAIWEVTDIPLLDLLGSLIDNNLLRQVPHDGESRLFMLETVREYALDQLAHHHEIEQAQQLHWAYFLALVEQAEPHLTGTAQAEWLNRLDGDQANLRAALETALKRSDAETAIRFSGALWRFWYLHGQLREGMRWLELSLAISESVSLPLRVKSLNGAGFLAANLGDYTGARELCEQALALAQAWGDKQAIAGALISLATTGVWQGNEVSLKFYAQALTLYQELHDPAGIALATTYLAWVHWFRADYDEAHGLFTEALGQFRGLNNPSGTAFALYGLGFVALNQRDDKNALNFYTEALSIMQSIGDKRGLIRAFYGLGRLALNRGDSLSARTHLEQCFALSKEIGDQWSVANGLAGLAGLAAGTGKPGLAAGLLGAADAQWDRIGVELSPAVRFWYEYDAGIVHKTLDDTNFKARYHEGYQWTPEQALAEVAKAFVVAPAAAHSVAAPFGLTMREQEVLRLVAAGLTDPQIAQKLVISVRTAQSHVSAILGKLGVSSRAAAARLAAQHDLV